MRSLRDQHDVTADAVASRARELGLRWQRSTVASIETGRRGLSAEELLLLPLVLSMALPVRVSLPQLLDEEAALSEELTMTRAGFAQLLDPVPGMWGGYRLQSTATATPLTDATNSGPSVERWQRIEQLWPEVHAPRRFDLRRLAAIENSASSTAEQNAARALDTTPLEVATVAHRLWGHGLTEERDRRLLDAKNTSVGASVRVRRGHVTRVLLDELSPLLSPDS